MHIRKFKLYNKFIAITTLVVGLSTITFTSIAAGIPGICSGSNVNYRQAADVNSNKIGQLQAGDKVSVIAAENDWYKVTINSGYVYIKKDLIKVTSNAYSTEDNINVRTAPSTSAEIIGQLYKNDNVNITSQSGDWYKINYNGKNAWVYGQYMKVINKDFSSQIDNTTPANTTLTGTGNINGDSVNLRKDASTGAAIITQLSLNTNVEVLSKNGDWYNIRCGQGTGWVLAKFVTITTSQNNTSASTISSGDTKKYVYVVSEQGVNLRTYPTVNAEKKLLLVFGEKLAVVKNVNDEWIQVETNKGEDGYVYQDFVDNVLTNNNIGKGKVIVSASQITAATETSTDDSSSLATSVVAYAKKFQGTPYVWGGTSLTRGVDCSGFTSQVMAKFGIDIPRTSRDQATVGTYVKRSELKAGDLVFFDSYNQGYVTHVGIYVGNNKFIQACSAKKYNRVIISDLSTYDNAYVTARRVIK